MRVNSLFTLVFQTECLGGMQDSEDWLMSLAIPSELANTRSPEKRFLFVHIKTVCSTYGFLKLKENSFPWILISYPVWYFHVGRIRWLMFLSGSLNLKTTTTFVSGLLLKNNNSRYILPKQFWVVLKSKFKYKLWLLPVFSVTLALEHRKKWTRVSPKSCLYHTHSQWESQSIASQGIHQSRGDTNSGHFPSSSPSPLLHYCFINGCRLLSL